MHQFSAAPVGILSQPQRQHKDIEKTPYVAVDAVLLHQNNSNNNYSHNNDDGGSIILSYSLSHLTPCLKRPNSMEPQWSQKVGDM